MLHLASSYIVYHVLFSTKTFKTTALSLSFVILRLMLPAQRRGWLQVVKFITDASRSKGLFKNLLILFWAISDSPSHLNLILYTKYVPSVEGYTNFPFLICVCIPCFQFSVLL